MSSPLASVLLAELDGDALDVLADRIAARLAQSQQHEDEWLDSRSAAKFLGIHRDTLRRLAAAGRLPCEQDGPGCKLYFRRSQLERWRASGLERTAA